MMEPDCLKKVIEGDVSAFSYFIEKYKGMAFSISFRIINNREDAEEAVQDAFVKAFKSLKSFRRHAKFSTWFYKIVVNTALSKAKKKIIFKEDLGDDALEEPAIEHVELAYKGLTTTERKKFINLALAELAMEERLLLTLYYVNENSIEEIEEITAVKAANIKMKLYRARAKMFVILERKLKGELQYLL